jgi:hypothetical protein
MRFVWLFLATLALAGCAANEPGDKSHPDIFMLRCDGRYQTTGRAAQPDIRTYRINLKTDSVEQYLRGDSTWETREIRDLTHDQATIRGGGSEIIEGAVNRTTFRIDRITGHIVDNFEITGSTSAIGFGFEGTCQPVATPSVQAKF